MTTRYAPVSRERSLAAKPATREPHTHDGEPAAIRWDTKAQLWVCVDGCAYSRPATPDEVVTGPDYGEGYAPMIGKADKVVDYVRFTDWDGDPDAYGRGY